MIFLKYLSIFSLASLLFGQIIRLPFGTGALNVSDISVLILNFAGIIYFLAIKKSLKFPKPILPFGLIFILSLSLSTFFALSQFSPSEVFASSFFLIRFISYFFMGVIFFNLVKKEEVENWFKLIIFIGLIFTLLGFAQLIFFADLTSLTIFGWDPHIQRMVSTILDPNYAGLIFVILFSISTTFFIKYTKIIYFFLSLIFLLAIIFTFSRSSYLALLFAILTIGFIKSRLLLLSTLTVFLAALFLIPQARLRVVGALTIDETAQARITSWQNAAYIARDNPVFGVGFNTYRLAQAKYGFFSTDNSEGGHSGSGSDSSFLLTIATGGIFAAFFYIVFLVSLFKNFLNGSKENNFKLISLATLVSLFIHSQFVNSFFFPQIMLLIWPIFALTSKSDSDN